MSTSIPVSSATMPAQGLPCVQAQDVTGNQQLQVDVVVVGSGAGGAVAAYEFAAAGKSVLILEAGPYVPSTAFTEDLVQAFGQLYQDQGGQVNTRGDLNILQGACVGGSTVVNGAVCFRTPDFILADWQRDFGLTALTPAALAPHFAAVEEHLHIHENQPHEINTNARTIQRGCEALGVSWKPLRRNIRDCALTGFCLAGCASDRKQSMLVTYLPWAIAHGAKLHADTHVTRVLAEQGVATGVVADVIDPRTKQKKGELQVTAKVVVLAAGAVQTPLILQRSGLANGSGQLGRNFACHPSTGVVGRYPEDIHLWRGALLGIYVDEYLAPEKGGFILEAGGASPTELTLFVDPGLGEAYDRFMLDSKHYAGLVTLIHDHNVGRVYLDDDGHKRIEYDLDQMDFPAMKASLKAAARIHFAAGAERVHLPTVAYTVIERAGDIDAVIDAIPNEAHALRLVSYHPQGTARMGADAAASVVGPTGEVHDVQRLFVTDASLLPTSIIVNPQLTVYALSRWISRGLLARPGGYLA